MDFSPSPYSVRLRGTRWYVFVVRDGTKSQLLPGFGTRGEAEDERDRREARRQEILGSARRKIAENQTLREVSA